MKYWITVLLIPASFILAQRPIAAAPAAKKADSLAVTAAQPAKTAVPAGSAGTGSPSVRALPGDTALDTSRTKPAAPAGDTVAYSADVIQYLRKDSLLILIGHAELKNQGMQLKADTIYYRTDIKRLEAAGKPVLTDNGDVVCGDRMVYLLNEKRGKITYGTTHSQDNIYNGEAIARLEDESFLVKNGDFSTCDNDSNPHYFFFGKKMKIMPKDKAIVRPVVLNIGDVPVGILPYFIFPIHKGRQSGLLTPRWGQFSQGGNMNSYLNNVGYYFALSDYTDLESKMDFTNGEGYFFQHIYLNSIFNYNKRYLLNGSINARMETSRSDESSTKNYGVSYSHSQNLLPDESFYLRGSGDIVGNSNYYRQSSLERNDYLKRELSSNMALVKNFKDAGINANVDVSYRQNLDTQEKTLKAPSFSLNTVSRPLIPFMRRENEDGDPLPLDSIPWYGKINVGYGTNGIHTRQTTLERRFSVIDSTADTSSRLHSYDAVDMRHNINFGLSQNPRLGYINILPRFGFSSNWFFKERTPAKSYTLVTRHNGSASYVDTVFLFDTLSRFHTREEYSMGADLNTTVYGVSKLNLGRLAGFRHTLTPGIGYTYAPELKGGEKYISAGTANNSNRDKQQTVSMGLGNLFQAKLAGSQSEKDSHAESYNLLNLNVGTNYNFTAKNRAGKETGRWGDLSSNASTNLYTLDLSYSGTHSFYDENDNFIPRRQGASLSNRLPRLLGYNVSASTGTHISGKFSGGGSIKAEAVNPAEPMQTGMNPWNLGLNFSYNYSSAYNPYFKVFETSSTFSLRDNLTLNFTDNWQLGYSSIYDFRNNELVDQSMNLNRDFHCWEAVFNWVMNGYRSGFYFRIGVKEIPDVKFEKRGGQYGGYYGGMSFPGQGYFGN